MSININDPRITQYALEEMAIDEIDAFEEEIKDNKEILQEIEDIKSFSNIMKDGLKNEPNLSLSEERKNLIEKSSVEGGITAPKPNRVFIKFILSAAAMIVISIIIFNGDIEKKSVRTDKQSAHKLEKLAIKGNLEQPKLFDKKDKISNVTARKESKPEGLLTNQPLKEVESIEIPVLREDAEVVDCDVSLDDCEIAAPTPDVVMHNIRSVKTSNSALVVPAITTIPIAKKIKLKPRRLVLYLEREIHV